MGDQRRRRSVPGAAADADSETAGREVRKPVRRSSLKAARAAFGTLGDAIMSYVKASGSRYGDGVTAAFCPMVQKYWLQKGDTVQNPFYGKAMSDCGRIVR